MSSISSMAPKVDLTSFGEYFQVAIQNDVCNLANTLAVNFLFAREEIVPDRNAKYSWEYIKFPHLIRFSSNPELVAKMKALGIPMLHEEGSYLFPESYAIPAKHYLNFFEGVKEIHGKDSSKFCIDYHQFDTVHSLLQREGVGLEKTRLLSDGQQSSDVFQTMPLKKFEEDVLKTRNVEKAVFLFNHYRKEDFKSERTLYWLVKAKQFLGDKSIAEYVDLDKFFQSFTSLHVESADLLMPNAGEIAQAVARASSIKILYLSPYIDYDIELTERIGSFIEKCNSLEVLNMNSVERGGGTKLNPSTITPIANALQKNTSLKKIAFVDSRIGDKGILKIIHALKSNPLHKITEINFAATGMTDKSAKEVLEFYKMTPQIKYINVALNDDKMLSDLFSMSISAYKSGSNANSIQKYLTDQMEAEALKIQDAGGVVSESIYEQIKKINAERDTAEIHH